MKELIEAAKAVCDLYDCTGTVEECEAVNRLYEAVERAESDDEIDRQNQEAMNIHLSGVMAERERIRARVFVAANKTWVAGDTYIGPPHWTLQQFVDALLEDKGE